MALFYRGAAKGTYWHLHDARSSGFCAQNPLQNHSLDRLMNHIVFGTVTSPYISLTRSFGIAANYATELWTNTSPSCDDPAYVYEIEIGNPLPRGLTLIDPIREVVQSFPRPEANFTYHHNGDNRYLLGVISPTKMKKYLRQTIRQPPPEGGTPCAPALSTQLQTIVRALRDAEVLALGSIPADAIRARYEIW